MTDGVHYGWVFFTGAWLFVYLFCCIVLYIFKSLYCNEELTDFPKRWDHLCFLCFKKKGSKLGKKNHERIIIPNTGAPYIRLWNWRNTEIGYGFIIWVHTPFCEKMYSPFKIIEGYINKASPRMTPCGTTRLHVISSSNVWNLYPVSVGPLPSYINNFEGNSENNFVISFAVG